MSEGARQPGLNSSKFSKFPSKGNARKGESSSSKIIQKQKVKVKVSQTSIFRYFAPKSDSSEAILHNFDNQIGTQPEEVTFSSQAKLRHESA